MTDPPIATTSPGRGAVRLVLVPAAAYLAALYLFTFPMLHHFGDRFFCDGGDGLQNVWNIWWFDQAVGRGLSPWHTDMLVAPHGATLVGQTLNPFNGLCGLVLLRVMPLMQAHNSLVVFAFVAGGWTAFLLARHLTGHDGAGLVAGGLFTFSSYHFTHAMGHLQLVSLQWLPLFALCWLRLLERPSHRRALAAAAALLAVELCDYYYLLYCVVWGALAFGYRAWCDGSCFLCERRLATLATFAAAAAALCGPLPLAVVRTAAADPFTGHHDSLVYSMDLLAMLVPGGRWNFRDWTEPLWSRFAGGPNETSLYLGSAVLLLAAATVVRRRQVRASWTGLWILTAAVFFVLALGPRLQILGARPGNVGLPYGWLEEAIPFLKLSGAPVRMSVMVSLAAAMLCAAGWRHFRLDRGRRLPLGLALLAVTAFDVMPLPPNHYNCAPQAPAYVEFLRTTPAAGTVIDRTVSPTVQLYHQTLHRRPYADGYISRSPASVKRVLDGVSDRLAAGDLHGLHAEHGVVHLVLDDTPTPAEADFPVVFRADGRRVLDLSRPHLAADPSRPLRR